jgi:hypothetical protein
VQERCGRGSVAKRGHVHGLFMYVPGGGFNLIFLRSCKCTSMYFYDVM